MDDEDFNIEYGEDGFLEYQEELGQPVEYEVTNKNSEEFERAVLRYAKVKKVSFEASTMLMTSNPDLVREWGVR